MGDPLAQISVCELWKLKVLICHRVLTRFAIMQGNGCEKQ